MRQVSEGEGLVGVTLRVDGRAVPEVVRPVADGKGRWAGAGTTRTPVEPAQTCLRKGSFLPPP